MNNEIIDEFLNEATHEVAARWEKAGGRRLNSEELYSLNDLLTSFFDGGKQL